MWNFREILPRDVLSTYMNHRRVLDVDRVNILRPGVLVEGYEDCVKDVCNTSKLSFDLNILIRKPMPPQVFASIVIVATRTSVGSGIPTTAAVHV
jgi:hypothetical protein